MNPSDFLKQVEMEVGRLSIPSLEDFQPGEGEIEESFIKLRNDYEQWINHLQFAPYPEPSEELIREICQERAARKHMEAILSLLTPYVERVNVLMGRDCTESILSWVLSESRRRHYCN